MVDLVLYGFLFVLCGFHGCFKLDYLLFCLVLCCLSLGGILDGSSLGLLGFLVLFFGLV